MADYKKAATSEAAADKQDFGTRCGKCMGNCCHFCYNNDNGARFCNMTCSMWIKILACYTVYYIGAFIFTYLLLEAVKGGSLVTLWIFFAIFVIFFVIVVAGVVYGHYTRKEETKIER